MLATLQMLLRLHEPPVASLAECCAAVARWPELAGSTAYQSAALARLVRDLAVALTSADTLLHVSR